MTLSNWIAVAVLIIILLAGGILLARLRRKLRDLDGFEGIVTEHGLPTRRADEPDWEAEMKRLEDRKK